MPVGTANNKFPHVSQLCTNSFFLDLFDIRSPLSTYPTPNCWNVPTAASGCKVNHKSPFLSLSLLCRHSLSQVLNFSSTAITKPKDFKSHPDLNYLPMMTWRQVFCPNVTTRFDFVIRLSSSIEKVERFFGKFHKTKDNERVGSRQKTPFKNVRRSQQTSSPVFAVRELGDINIDEQAMIEKAAEMTARALPRQSGKKQPQNNQTSSHLTFESPLDESHAVVGLLIETFHVFVGKLRSQFGGICDLFYDSLAVPYPLELYGTINPEAVAPQPLSAASFTGCPKTLFKLPSTRQTSSSDTSDEDDDDDDNTTMGPTLSQIMELPSIPLLIGAMTSEGSSFIDSIELL